MAMNRLNADKTELVVIHKFKNNGKLVIQSVNMTYADIQAIRIKKCIEKKLFSKKESEVIEITNSKTPKPVQFFEIADKHFYDEYKMLLKKFAQNNKITFSEE